MNVCREKNAEMQVERTKKQGLTQNQKGQTLVEFMMIILLITILSFSFLRSVNTGITNYWLALGNLILDDSSQRLRMRR